MKVRFDLFSILVVNFSGALGFSLVIPFLVILVKHFGGDAVTYGIISALYSFFQFLGSPILGKWSDIHGRKPIIIISQIGTFVGWTIFFTALFLPINPLFKIGSLVITLPLFVMAFSRCLDGLTGGNVSIAQAYLADISTEHERSKDYGKLTLSSNLGFIVGPALAGILGSTVFGAKAPVAFAIAVSLFTAIFVWKYLPESHRKITREKIKFSEILKRGDINYMLVLYFLIYLGFSIYYTAFPVHAISTLSWTVAKMGWYFSIMALFMALVQGPLLSYLSKKIKDSYLIILGGALLGINFIMLLSRSDLVIFSSTLFFALGNGLMWPSFLSLLSKVAGRTFQGTVQGLSSSMGSLASIVGLTAGGFLYNKLGSLSFAVTAGVLYFVMILCFRLIKFEKQLAV